MEDYRLERHFKLWEENNKQIKRVIFLTVAISLALVVKVLVPFVDYSQTKKPILQRIDLLEQEKERVNEKMEVIERTEKILNNVSRFISAQPWQQEKEVLIRRYQGMRIGHDRASYQREADQTIRNIAAMLHGNIVGPLRQSSGASGGRDRDLGRLSEEIEALSAFIDEWQAEYIGKRWYDTIRRKGETMSSLTRDLNQRLNNFSRVVRQELAALKQIRESVNKESESLNSQIESEGSNLDDIDKELQSILPQWVRGLVKTYQVIQLLPLVLVAVAAYVLAIGMNLTGHYKAYAAGKKFDKELISEPAMSSTWTLLPRGRYGTMQTIAAYSVFFVFSWLLLEKSIGLLLDWLMVDSSQAWIAAPALWEGFLWFSRIAFVMFILYVCTMPWRTKDEKEPS